ncbi:MAG: hypothetical protein LBB61_08570 [Treponema sp.]|jgi:hypothetical protein|nr:hypothetical protein [Treponema sp.]
MNKKLSSWAMLVSLLALLPVGCGDLASLLGGDKDKEDEKKPKTLVIQDIPADVYAHSSSGVLNAIGIFPAGTTMQQTLARTTLAARADLPAGAASGSGPYAVTVSLYTPNGDPWTESGTYAVYVTLGANEDGTGGRYYKADPVSFTSETTSISFNSDAAPAYLSDPERGGSLNFTGIESKYNGQYASFRSSASTPPYGGDYLVGGRPTSTGLTGSLISDGSVTIPVYLANGDGTLIGPYSGSYKNITVYLSIQDTSLFTISDLMNDIYKVTEGTVNSETFTDGNESGTNENTNPPGGDTTALVIRNIPADVYAYSQSGGGVLIFPAGTTPSQAMGMSPIAKADLSNNDVERTSYGSYYALTLPLYTYNTDTRWMGSGTYLVYVILNGDGGHYYATDSVSFSSGAATVDFGGSDGTGGSDETGLAIDIKWK